MASSSFNTPISDIGVHNRYTAARQVHIGGQMWRVSSQDVDRNYMNGKTTTALYISF
jgi:hypothetical protein